MATSRDDFVIAIRSAFLKKSNKQRFSLIGLIFFSIGLLILTKINLPVTNYLKITLNEIVYRTSFIISIPEKKIKDFSNLINEHYFVYKKFQQTKEQLAQLKSEKYETKFIIEENIRLKKLIDEYIISSNELAAKVLIVSNDCFWSAITQFKVNLLSFILVPWAIPNWFSRVLVKVFLGLYLKVPSDKPSTPTKLPVVTSHASQYWAIW